MPKFLQVCFVVDCSKAMTAFMNSFKNSIVPAIQECINRQRYYVKLEVALIGFRDFYSNPEFERIEFTDDLQSFERSLSRIQTTGAPGKLRNVTEALSHARNMRWYAKRTLMVIISSAPTHGTKYHEFNGDVDDFPNGHPWLSIEVEIFELAKSNIDVIIVELNKTTRKMIEVMKSEYHDGRNSGFNIVSEGQMLQKITSDIQKLIEN